MNTIASALAVALVLAGTVAKVQADKADGLAVRLAVAERQRAEDRIRFGSASEAQKRAIAALEAARADDQKRIDALAQDNARIAEERNHEKRKFEDYRARLAEAALAKPGLVGRAATRAVGRLFDAFRGASAADGRAPDGTPGTVPSAAAPADRGAR
jgi:hypothetical protein